MFFVLSVCVHWKSRRQSNTTGDHADSRGLAPTFLGSVGRLPRSRLAGFLPKLSILIRRKFLFYKEEQAVLSVGSCLQSEWYLEQVQGALL